VLQPGERLERYEIVRVLGAGGFGVTYRATDLQLGNDVAIKEYFNEQCANRNGRDIFIIPSQEDIWSFGKEDFLQEARRLAKFRHPNIVGIKRFFEANNTAYIVMDFLDGRNMSEWLGELDGDIPTQEEFDLLMYPLLDALELVHKNRMLHKDIKPANIMITKDGEAVFIDFGAAREAIHQRSTDVHALVSPGYSPPEQYYISNPRVQGPWTDIYAFSATIYRAITGRPPEESPNRDPGDQIAMNVSQRYSNRFLLGIQRGLELDRKKRPQSVSEWREMLFTQSELERSHIYQPKSGLGGIIKKIINFIVN